MTKKGLRVEHSIGTEEPVRGGTTRSPCFELRRDVRQLLVDGAPARLGGRAFDLLVALADRPRQLTSKDELMQILWPREVVEENTLQVHISALRKLLGPEAIRTVPGRGYLLALLVEDRAVAVPTGGTGAAPPVNVSTLSTSRLPHDLPPLIGRDPDLKALQELLAHHRLVTVVGPGGVGKTRLALAAATWAQQKASSAVDSAVNSWAGSVHLIELAGVTESAPVAEAVARTLGISLPGLQAASAELVDVLEKRELLLVLDNCEHRLREAGELVDALARNTPRVRVLATSQQPLGCRSEKVLRLESLVVPQCGVPLTEALASGSVALLIERVRSRDASFAVDADNAADAVAICQRLDGLPLAIELAAARVPLLGLAGLRLRLNEQLRVLAVGPGREREARPMRQRTLRAAIAWSHALLDTGERRIFRRLGAFAGSFSLAAAEVVASDPADGETDSLDRLQALVDRSLVLVDKSAPLSVGNGARLRMLDSTHSFALEQLHAAGEHCLVMQRLCDAMLTTFELNAIQRGQHTGGIARTCAPDIGNLRAALDWLGSQPTMALRHIELAGAAAWVWLRVGLRQEGLRRCRDALDRVSADTPAALEARLQLGYARQIHRRATAEDCAVAQRAATLYAQLDDRLARFYAFSILAHMRALRNEEAPAMAALEAMADAFDPAANEIQWGTYLFTSGHALFQFNRAEQALPLLDKVRQLQIAYPSLPAQALIGLAEGQISALGCRFDEAFAHSQSGLAAARQLDASSRIGMLLGDMATYLIELNRLDEAVTYAREAIDVRARDGTLWLQLDQLAQLASARGRLREAALALGRAEVHNAWRPGRREAALRRPFELASAAVREAFTANELKAIYAQGAAMGDVEVARLTLGGAVAVNELPHY
jgi:predicted ATPase/DNA-binding winged helix-turn-helix (wHTH) protein